MPSNIHESITASAAGFPESPVEAGPRLFYRGLLAHLKAGEPDVLVRFNEDAADEIILCPGSTRVIGRGPNRAIQSFQARSLGPGDATLTLEFTEDAPADALVWHASGEQGPEGPMGPQGDIGPAGPGAPSIRVRAAVGGAPINVLAGGTVDLVADAESLNVGAAYDAATGVLTTPVGEAGEYIVMASATTNGVALELLTRISSDGGATWVTLSRSPQSANGARITDFITLNDLAQLKFQVHNPTAGATDVLGTVGNEARSYLAITRIA